jgi:hypothetical protein
MITIKNGLNWTGLGKKVEALNASAMGAVGLQLLNNTVNGSMTVATRPPILEGTLRGSGSVFVGKRLIKTSKTGTKGTPNTSYSGKPDEITVGFNTAYAARWHENEFTPGPRSIQDGNVDWKYLEVHLKGDGDELMALYAERMRAGLK